MFTERRTTFISRSLLLKLKEKGIFGMPRIFGMPQVHYNEKNYDSYEYVIIYNKDNSDLEEVIFGKQFSEYWEAREECILEMI